MIPAPSTLQREDKPTLIGKTKAELFTILEPWGGKPYTASILYGWLYQKGARTFQEMTNISKSIRFQLEEHYSISRPHIITHLSSVDGTQKWLLRLSCGNSIETVFIPEPKRGTLCISSQIGCTLNCKFCHTGTQRLKRNLTGAEIVAQVLLAMDTLDLWQHQRNNNGLRLTNIVLMGMGEPLYNVENVWQAVKLITDGEGMGFSKRKVTLSTSGVVPQIIPVGADLGVKLAVSLHSVRDAIRDVIVPINRKYPLALLRDACRNYPGLSNAKRITWEYVMLKDINDSPEDAKELVQFIRGIPSKINLIPYNPWPGSQYVCSSDEQIEKFASVVLKAGYASPVRKPRGQDIMAACGQLNSEINSDQDLSVVV